MTRAEAASHARRLLGPEGDAWWSWFRPPGRAPFRECKIGLRSGPVRVVRGLGKNWDEAVARAEREFGPAPPGR